MEFPQLGKHCTKSDCNKLDFLPFQCESCSQVFCDEHYNYSNHNCSSAYKKNNVVPICPLCNRPIPVNKGQHPDFIVGLHIDNDCQSDPAKSRRKVFINKCSFNKCKGKELLPVVCGDCSKNFCIKHRHPADHSCEGTKARNSYNTNFQGILSEDEALAKALALSLQDDSISFSKRNQEKLDRDLASQLQKDEVGGKMTRSTRNSNNCSVS